MDYSKVSIHNIVDGKRRRVKICYAENDVVNVESPSPKQTTKKKTAPATASATASSENWNLIKLLKKEKSIKDWTALIYAQLPIPVINEGSILRMLAEPYPDCYIGKNRIGNICKVTKEYSTVVNAKQMNRYEAHYCVGKNYMLLKFV